MTHVMPSIGFTIFNSTVTEQTNFTEHKTEIPFQVTGYRRQYSSTNRLYQTNVVLVCSSENISLGILGPTEGSWTNVVS